MAGGSVHEEIELLKKELKRLDQSGGNPTGGGIASVPFGVLVRDDRCSNIFEALVGTLKAAKKRKIVRYDSELLLQGVHDKVDVVLLED